MALPHRLALGTVQFGLPYGVANESGQVSRDDAAAILDHAWAAGLDTLDTAIAYGDSEQRLGEIGVKKWQTISKLPSVPENRNDVYAWVQEAVLNSMARLRVAKLRGLLLHCSQQLTGPHGDALYQALIALKEQGKVEKIGISIYDPEELDVLVPRFQLDMVQAPFNIIDRRLATSGWLTRLHQTGIEVHIRSVFLQGLLLMEPANRPAAFNRWQPLWDRWHCWLEQQSMNSVQACLGFAMSQPEISRVVVGVDSLRQFREILAGTEVPAIMPPASLASDDLDLINPSRWDKS
jgi:aryl-alcohol dehydrogenase-like predicted oxidoreductase